MGKGLPRSHTRGDPLVVHTLKQTFVAKALALTIDGASGVGFGSVVLGDFPEGNILFHGAVGYMSIAGPGGEADLDDNWAGDYSIGTTPVDDGTMSAGDEDLLPETALAAATAEVSPRTRAASIEGSNGVILDNTDGSLEINLNVLVDNANIGADGIAFTANGEFQLLYTMILDD